MESSVLNFRGPRRVILMIGGTLLILLVVARLLAPAFILKKLNHDLADFSPTYQIHIHDLELRLLRMAYRFKQTTVRLRSNGHEFVKIETIDVAISWSELFRGRILTDIAVKNAVASLSHELFAETKAAEATPKADASTAASKMFPVRVSSLRVDASSLQFGKLLGQPEESRWLISSIHAMLANLTPGPKSPDTYYTLQGTMLKSSMFKAAGRAKTLAKPIEWEVDAEVHDFDLIQTNEMMRKFAPLTFTAGRLDLFSEVKSEGGKITGYVKPFFKKMHVIGDSGDFKSLKHFGVEIVTAVGNAILRRSDTQTTATEVDFHVDNGKLKVDTGKALSKAIQHGFNEPIPENIEEKINLR